MSTSSCTQDPAIFLRHLLDVAIAQAQPQQVIQNYLPSPPKGRTLVLGAGKAAAAMAHAVEAAWPTNAPLSGLVVTRYHHTPTRLVNTPSSRIEIVEASHPVPDTVGLQSAQRMLSLTQGLTADDLVLCLISGGGSALLSCPATGISFEDKQAIHTALLRCGASISEMNCVRKHLSLIKGGRLGLACSPARVVTLAISDVPGDDPSVIASGPTVGDPSTCAQALEILDRYHIPIAQGLRERLEQGELETPKPNHPALAHHSFHLIATPLQSLQAAAQAAQQAGIPAYVLSDAMQGESREVAFTHAALARHIAQHQQPFPTPCVILSGGETSVTLTSTAQKTQGGGRGGRAGEFCLGLAHALESHPNIWALAADTDGIDGTQDNAGALVRPDTIARANALGMTLSEYMQKHDSYGFFQALGDLVVTGPTFTNVNDFRALWVC